MRKSSVRSSTATTRISTDINPRSTTPGSLAATREPIGIGFVIGILSAVLGVGGGFVLVPAMIYILGMPTAVVIGTSNFQILFVAANVTFLQAATNGTVDVVLALLLILGGVVGAPIGSRVAAKLPGVVLRGLMSVLILLVAVELLTELLRTPSE